jgi:hypothetical protein
MTAVSVGTDSREVNVDDERGWLDRQQLWVAVLILVAVLATVLLVGWWVFLQMTNPPID